MVLTNFFLMRIFHIHRNIWSGYLNVACESVTSVMGT